MSWQIQFCLTPRPVNEILEEEIRELRAALLEDDLPPAGRAACEARIATLQRLLTRFQPAGGAK